MKVKKVLSTILTLSMVFTLIPAIPAAAIPASTTINVGEYVQMGKYNNEPILWRCVDIDANGPLMLADKILTTKPFDAAGNHTYLDGTAQIDTNNLRTNNGSNLWETSNMRSWLNSTEAAGNVTWLDGCPPTADKVFNGLNEYATEKGFLAEGNFTSSELNAIRSVTQKSLLNSVDVAKLQAGGTTLHTYDSNIWNAVQNYDTSYYQNVTDKMFLLDVKQLDNVFKNSDILGENYYRGKAIENSWIRSSYSGSDLPSEVSNISCYYFDYVLIFGQKNYFTNILHTTANSPRGVRPAFNMNLKSTFFISGNGTAGTPYVVMDGSEPTPTSTATATPSPTATPTDASLSILTNIIGLPSSYVNVSVNISANSGLASGSYILHYDKTKLEVVTATSGYVLAASSTSVNSNVADGTVEIEFAGESGTNLAGKVLNVMFERKTTYGALPLTLEVVEMKNDNSDAIPYTITKGAINTYRLGDVTGDDRTSAADALKILQAVSGKIILNDAQKFAADVTKNGKVQASDALALLSMWAA